MVELNGKPDLAKSAKAKDISDGVVKLKAFKMSVEAELKVIEEKVSGVKQMFRDFAAAEKNRCAGVPLLSIGSLFFERMLDFKFPIIRKAIDIEVKAWEHAKKMAEEHLKQPQEQDEVAHWTIRNEYKSYASRIQRLFCESRIKRLDIGASLKTLRKTDFFGDAVEIAGQKEAFEWPRTIDILSFPKDRPAKLEGYKWRGSYFNFLQLKLTNQVASPIILGSKDLEDFERCEKREISNLLITTEQVA